MREHLEHFARRDDAKGEEARRQLRGPGLPDRIWYLWQWYLELAPGRQPSMSGPVLTWESVDAWARLTGTDVLPHEARGLLLIDRVVRDPGEMGEEG